MPVGLVCVVCMDTIYGILPDAASMQAVLRAQGPSWMSVAAVFLVTVNQQFVDTESASSQFINHPCLSIQARCPCTVVCVVCVAG